MCARCVHAKINLIQDFLRVTISHSLPFYGFSTTTPPRPPSRSVPLFSVPA